MLRLARMLVVYADAIAPGASRACSGGTRSGGSSQGDAAADSEAAARIPLAPLSRLVVVPELRCTRRARRQRRSGGGNLTLTRSRKERPGSPLRSTDCVQDGVVETNAAALTFLS